MTGALRIGVVAALTAAAPSVHAQSLADLARQEEARRATSKSVKSFSNADLKPGEIVASAPVVASTPADAAKSAEPAGCYMSISLGRCVSANEMLANLKKAERANFESSWRSRASRIRTLVARLQADIDAYTAIMDDSRRLESERSNAARKLVATMSAMRDQEGLWQVLEKEAAAAEMPHAWLEPVPVFPRQDQ